MNSVKNRILYFLFLAVFTVISLEILLRIFHPFPVRLKGDKIVLPQNQVYSIDNTAFPKLDKKIIHTKNSLGFRGAEKPSEIRDYLSIVTVGGSTTECFYIADNKDWTSLLNDNLKKEFRLLWVNNAGLEGHSTFGHQILLDDYIVKLKPRLVLFLTGINDVGIENLRAEEQHNVDKNNRPSILSSLSYYSETINLIRNIYKVNDAKKMNLINNKFNLVKMDTFLLTDAVIQKRLSDQISHALNYKNRILKLIETCRNHQIEPVLITQPCLYGSGADSLLRVNLETIKIDNKNNGKAGWLILQLYNDQLRTAGKETNTYVIDLANEMPKNSIYFYDFVHFTNQGCTKVAEIVSKDILSYLKDQYKEFYLENNF